VVLGASAPGPPGRAWHARREAVNIALRGRAAPEVTLEPSNQRWLFALDLPAELPRCRPERGLAEMEIAASYPLHQRVR
jgi:hypothetical protein